MLPNKLRAAVIAHRMVLPGDVAVIAVSGGPDSVSLLHALSGLSAELEIRLHVGHLNHLLRPEAARDAAYVRELAERLGWPVTITSCDVLALSRRHRLTMEEAARWARYSFLADVTGTARAAGVVVAHTADDQVETVVMHWLRGSSLGGLRGLRPVTQLTLPAFDFVHVSEVRVLRPMLDVSRNEVLAYCGKHQLRPREDASNRDESYLRNRVRWRLLPELRAYNRRLDETILRAARIAALDDDCLHSIVLEVWSRIVSERDGALAYDLAEWTKLAPSLQFRLLRRGVERLCGNLLDLSATHLEAGVRLMRDGSAGSTVHWPHGVRLTKRYSEFLLYRHREAQNGELSAEGERIAITGQTLLAGGRWQVTASVLGPERCPQAGPWHAHLDAAAVGSALRVRRRTPGDRFQPLGMRTEKKLQDFLVDSKVPRAERDDVPLVVDGDGRIAWVGPARVSDWAKVTADSAKVLCLTFDRLRSKDGRDGIN